MKANSWKFAYSSVIGTAHIETRLPCQDSSLCEVTTSPTGSNILITVASDGAGSARLSQIGSKLICQKFVEYAKSFFSLKSEVLDFEKDHFYEFIDEFRESLIELSENNNTMPSDYACTLVAAIVGEKDSVFGHIGDGGIVGSLLDKEEYICFSWPQQGFYANETHFSTGMNAWDSLIFRTCSEPLKEVAVFTDGLQNMALHYQSKTAYNPFFKPVFKWLSELPFSEEIISNSLYQYLLSDRINQRTNDDKTLILAQRIP